MLAFDSALVPRDRVKAQRRFSGLMKGSRREMPSLRSG